MLTHGELCVGCWSAVSAEGHTGTVHRDERLALSGLSIPVGYARDVIRRKVEIDGGSLPSEYQVEELGHIARIDSRQLFTRYEQATNDEIRARYRAIFGLADESSTARLDVPGVTSAIVVGRGFVEHPFELSRRRDEDHLKYAPLTSSTLLNPLEVYLHRDQESRHQHFRFLGCYYDLSTREYVYHLVIALSSGTLWTSYRLSRNAKAFRDKRSGKLLYAAYA